MQNMDKIFQYKSYRILLISQLHCSSFAWPEHHWAFIHFTKTAVLVLAGMEQQLLWCYSLGL